MTTREQGVCVIIAAYRAEATIARAVSSALGQPEVAEVAVVDDASPDGTAAAAWAADDGSGRLSVRTLPANAGPSRARNLAIDGSAAPLIALLDADDFFLPGRLERLLAVPDWDMVADDIAFIDEAEVQGADLGRIAAHRVPPRRLTPAGFVKGSITRAGRHKGELAFLKPVMRRAFLDAHRLRYDEGMRLAEDYDLYLRALLAGARFRVAGVCGYVAVERRGSLSHEHGAADLRRFERAIERGLAAAGSDPELRRHLHRHLRQTARRRRHRALLDRKREAGLLAALAGGSREPAGLLRALGDVARDKLRRKAPPPRTHGVRFLL